MSTGLTKTKDIYRDWLEALLSKLDMVEWDRFVYVPAEEANYITMRFYGWIEREDEYKDFIVFDVWPALGEYNFITSSDEFSEEIHNRLYDEDAEHNPCKRVENHFYGVSNAVELREKTGDSN